MKLNKKIKPAVALSFLLAATASFNAVAQETPEINNKGYDGVIERLPTYPGGDEGFKMDLTINTHYPKKALDKGVKGRVFVTFIITKEGAVDSIEVAKGVESSLDSAAMFAVSKLKKFKPATINDIPVTYRYIVPIKFDFTEDTPSSNSDKVPSIGSKKLKLMEVE